MNPSSFRSALTQLSVALFIATAAVHPTYSFAEDVPQDAQTNASAGGTVVETALTEAALERESAVPASLGSNSRRFWYSGTEFAFGGSVDDVLRQGSGVCAAHGDACESISLQHRRRGGVSRTANGARTFAFCRKCLPAGSSFSRKSVWPLAVHAGNGRGLCA